MQTYKARITCRECDTEDEVSFSFAGKSIALDSAEAIVNDTDLVTKRCWQCFNQDWRINSLTTIARQESGTAVRM